MSPFMQLFVVLTIFIFIFFAYLWRRDTFTNVFLKFTMIFMGAGWTIYLLASLGYLGGK